MNASLAERALPAADFAFTRSWHDRLGLLRGDDEWLARQWQQEVPSVMVTDGFLRACSTATGCDWAPRGRRRPASGPCWVATSTTPGLR
jgi:hypothetical protein